MDDLREGLERQIEQLRRGIAERLDGGSELADLLEAESGTTTLSGRVEENGAVFTWSKDADGHVRVAVKDSAEHAERVYEADSLDALRESAPAVAKRLDDLTSGSGRIRIDFGAPFARTLPRFDQFRDHLTERLGPDSERMRDWMRRFFDESLVDEFRPGAPDDRPMLGIEWSAPTDALRSQLEIPSGGMIVTRVLPGTPAEQLGLRKHDVLLELGGSRVSRPHDIAAALAQRAEGDTLTALVIRRAQKLELTTKN